MITDRQPDQDTPTPRTSKDLSKRIAALTKKYRATCLSEFRAGFKALFAQYPRLKTVSWSAADEYNDEGGSDWCSTHEEASINGASAYDDALEGDDGDNLYALAEPAEGRPADKEAAAIVKAVQVHLAAFESDFYEYEYPDGANANRRSVTAD